MTTSVNIIAAILRLNISAKFLHVQMVGVAYVDIISCQFQLCQFVDSMNLINLESVIVQLAAKECLVVASSDGDSRATSLRQLLDRSNVAITERKKGSFLLCVCFNLPARSRLI